MMRFPLVLISIPVYLYSILVTACDPRHTNRPLYGLRCVSNVTAERRQAAHPQCVWRCLRMKTCRYINYNSAEGQCELGLGQCESLQPATGVRVNTFGPPRHDCIHWGSVQEPGWVALRGTVGHAARIVSGEVMLIGIFFPRTGQFWANKQNTGIGPVYQDIQLMYKDATCPSPWMPYTAGEPLPSGAVPGGHLADGSATYVARIMDSNELLVFGYYNPKSAAAYYKSGGTHTTNSMDILVLL